MNSIRRHLLVALLGAISAALLIGGMAIYRAALDEVDELFDYQLRQLALSLRDQAFHNAFAPPAENEEADMDFVIQVWDSEGVRVYFSHPHLTLPGLVKTGYATVNTPEGSWRVFSTRLYKQAIQVAQPLRVRNRMALETAVHVLLPLLLLLPLLSLVIWILVSRGLTPLNRLARAVATRTPQALEPLPIAQTPDEVLPLVHSLNDLLHRLSEAIAAQKAFIADAAHELRTPIAALQLQAQLLERADSAAESSAAIADLKAGILRAGHAVRQLLTLARQEPDLAAKPMAAVNLAELARSVATELSPLARDKNIDLGLADVDEPASILGDPDSLRIMLANLVENAVRYTPRGGRVDVSVISAEQAVRLEVADSGPGIPAWERARVFDRFYRSEQASEPGTGLGLAIVKAVADRHGAEIELDQAKAGGLWVRVVFPRCDNGMHREPIPLR